MSATYLRLSAALLSLSLFVITPNLTGAQPFTMYGAEFGAATDLGRLVSGGSALFHDLDFAPNGVMYGATSQITSDSFYRIDLPTATATLIGVTGGNLGSIASIPEPCSLALLALGGGLLSCIGPSKLRKPGTFYRLLAATVSSGVSRQGDTK